jgi:hypothetical protein
VNDVPTGSAYLRRIIKCPATILQDLARRWMSEGEAANEQTSQVSTNHSHPNVYERKMIYFANESGRKWCLIWFLILQSLVDTLVGIV